MANILARKREALMVVVVLLVAGGLYIGRISWQNDSRIMDISREHRYDIYHHIYMIQGKMGWCGYKAAEAGEQINVKELIRRARSCMSKYEVSMLENPPRGVPFLINPMADNWLLSEGHANGIAILYPDPVTTEHGDVIIAITFDYDIVELKTDDVPGWIDAAVPSTE